MPKPTRLSYLVKHYWISHSFHVALFLDLKTLNRHSPTTRAMASTVDRVHNPHLRAAPRPCSSRTPQHSTCRTSLQLLNTHTKLRAKPPRLKHTTSSQHPARPTSSAIWPISVTLHTSQRLHATQSTLNANRYLDPHPIGQHSIKHTSRPCARGALRLTHSTQYH